jgi:hypothetical protein
MSRRVEAPRAAGDWSDLVFHVLAHVSLPNIPASLYSPEYVQYAAATAGPARARPLGDGAAVLAASLRTHANWARLQLVAWLFHDVARAQAAALMDIAELASERRVTAALQRALVPVLPAAEFLRASALLEAPVHAALPAQRWDRAALAAELAHACAIAPRLATTQVYVAPALTVHGRVGHGAIWIGAPAQQLAVSVAHAALQAAHEATVLEVGEADTQRGAHLSEREREAVAVVLLAERARAQHRSEAHATWAARWGLRPEHCAREGLAPAALTLARELLGT